MITLSGRRFVGVSQADETRRERSKRVNHAMSVFNLHSQPKNAPARYLTRRYCAYKK
jgi:hypothetical protein